METTIGILGIEKKIGKEKEDGKPGRPYTSVLTTEGRMTAFEAAKELDKCIGQTVVVNVEERNGFKNITKFIKSLGPAIANQIMPVVTPLTAANGEKVYKDSFAEARNLKDQSMYT